VVRFLNGQTAYAEPIVFGVFGGVLGDIPISSSEGASGALTFLFYWSTAIERKAMIVKKTNWTEFYP
jgi:hypothetical protein